MYINLSTKTKQQRIKHHSSVCDAFSFFNQLTSSELLNTTEMVLPEHRERLFPPTETLSMFLAQGLKPDRSCQNIVNDAAIKRLADGVQTCSTHTSWL